MEYDIIGDIHGNAEALKGLLYKLGYRKSGLSWTSPSSRKIIFVGDFIDRGKDQVEAIRIARELIESDRAMAVMGNHELNSIAWYYGYRPDTPKNRKQHQAFLQQIDDRSQQHTEAIRWFLTLPLWLDLPEIRVVHACWDPQSLKTLGQKLEGAVLNRDQIELATKGTSNAFDANGQKGEENELFSAVETLLKGLEVALPEPHSFRDKDGHERCHVRLKWWLEPPASYREASMTKLDPDEPAFEKPIPNGVLPSYDNLKPLFLGHYWQTGIPKTLSPKIACVDYSAGKGGPLVAYCWRGEEDLNDASFATSESSPPVRPERFAWTDEDALVIFGEGWRKMAQKAVREEVVETTGRARILLAGRRDIPIDDVRVALEAARDATSDRFVILERSGQYFMQCLCKEFGWLLEKREGDEEHHFGALVKSEKNRAENGTEDLMSRIFAKRSESSRYLDFEQVLEALSYYLEGWQEPDWLEWERISV